jgi:hypothetical protein
VDFVLVRITGTHASLDLGGLRLTSIHGGVVGNDIGVTVGAAPALLTITSPYGIASRRSTVYPLSGTSYLSTLAATINRDAVLRATAVTAEVLTDGFSNSLPVGTQPLAGGVDGLAPDEQTLYDGLTVALEWLPEWDIDYLVCPLPCGLWKAYQAGDPPLAVPYGGDTNCAAVYPLTKALLYNSVYRWQQRGRMVIVVPRFQQS